MPLENRPRLRDVSCMGESKEGGYMVYLEFSTEELNEEEYEVLGNFTRENYHTHFQFYVNVRKFKHCK